MTDDAIGSGTEHQIASSSFRNDDRSAATGWGMAILLERLPGGSVSTCEDVGPRAGNQPRHDGVDDDTPSGELVQTLIRRSPDDAILSTIEACPVDPGVEKTTE